MTSPAIAVILYFAGCGFAFCWGWSLGRRTSWMKTTPTEDGRWFQAFIATEEGTRWLENHRRDPETYK